MARGYFFPLEHCPLTTNATTCHQMNNSYSFPLPPPPTDRHRMNSSYSFPPPPPPPAYSSHHRGTHRRRKRSFQTSESPSTDTNHTRESQSSDTIARDTAISGLAKRARILRHDAESDEEALKGKITLPSFREAFQFALNDASELQAQDRTHEEQHRGFSFPPPPPLKVFRAPADARHAIHLAAPSRYHARSARNVGSYQNPPDIQTQSPSPSDYDAECTIFPSRSTSEHTNRGSSSPIPRFTSAYVPHSHGRYNVQYQLRHEELPTTSILKNHERFYRDGDMDQENDTNRGRSHSQSYSTGSLSGPFTCSYRSPSTSLDSTSEISTRTSVSPDSPRTAARSRRPRPSNGPGQPWEEHALESANQRNYYNCCWVEDGFKCRYRAKKQAMKRHVELTHLKYKPHKCDLCGKSYGQRTSLEVHLATHTGDKDHVCPEPGCSKAYSDASRLLRHRMKIHGYKVRPTAAKYRFRKGAATSASPKKRNNASATKPKERAGARKRRGEA